LKICLQHTQTHKHTRTHTQKKILLCGHVTIVPIVATCGAWGSKDNRWLPRGSWQSMVGWKYTWVHYRSFFCKLGGLRVPTSSISLFGQHRSRYWYLMAGLVTLLM